MFLKYFLKNVNVLIRFNSMIMNSKPIIVIFGSTGTGKTKLSVELAKKFNGEIINADSMQVYKGLDIVTAKATVEERCDVKHHIFDFLDPLKYFSVVDFRNMAIKIINDLLNIDKTPIIVGGTNYYIEALLWQVLIPDLNTRLITDNFDDDFKWKNVEFIDRSIDNSSLHEILYELDPETANKLHPNDRRRVLRAIQVIKQTGRKMSDLINDQQNAIGGSSLGGPLRFSNSVVLWLHCNQDVLDERLNHRVDEMIENGLVYELIDFHDKFNKQRLANNSDTTPDYTTGIFQTIGFKEFHDYLIQLKDHKIVINDEFKKSVDNMKIATRRYARKQVKYIKNHLLGHTDRQVPPVYQLDVTNLEKWHENVFNKSCKIIESYMNGDITMLPIEFKPISTEISKERNQIKNDRTRFKCVVCKKIFIGSYQFNIHKKSKKHKANMHDRVEMKLSQNNTV